MKLIICTYKMKILKQALTKSRKDNLREKEMSFQLRQCGSFANIYIIIIVENRIERELKIMIKQFWEYEVSGRRPKRVKSSLSIVER